MASFSRLSQRVTVTGEAVAARDVVRRLLLGVVGRLGPDAAGHAKAAAHLGNGVLHGSTTGTPPEVDFKTSGPLPETASHVIIDVLCAFYGVRQKDLTRAWSDTADELCRDGVSLQTSTRIPGTDTRGPQGTLAGSVLSSFLVLKPCCLIPALWSVSGGTIGALQVFAPLEPYRPVFLALSLGLLGLAFFRLYLRPPTGYRVTVRSLRLSRGMFWAASLGFAFAVVIPMLLGPNQSHTHTHTHSHPSPNSGPHSGHLLHGALS